MMTKISRAFPWMLLALASGATAIGLRAWRRTGSEAILATVVIYLVTALTTFLSVRRDPRNGFFGLFGALSSCYITVLEVLLNKLGR